jgi:prolyl oligopeptidase
VLDMLRYHQFTIGWAWASDYGRSDDSEEMFRCLLAYSPVHNTREVAYPPTLVLTGDHDDRVVPGHSYKFAASLQHAQQGAEPVLIRVETRAGHGAGTPVSLLVDEVADRWSFLAWALDFEPTLPAR